MFDITLEQGMFGRLYATLKPAKPLGVLAYALMADRLSMAASEAITAEHRLIVPRPVEVVDMITNPAGEAVEIIYRES